MDRKGREEDYRKAAGRDEFIGPTDFPNVLTFLGRQLIRERCTAPSAHRLIGGWVLLLLRLGYFPSLPT